MPATLQEAEVLFRKGKIDQAKQTLERLVEENPEHPGILNDLGVIAFNEQRLGEAATYFSRAISADPFHIEAVSNYCGLLESIGSLHKALPILETVLHKYPDNAIIAEFHRKAQQNQAALALADTCGREDDDTQSPEDEECTTGAKYLDDDAPVSEAKTDPGVADNPPLNPVAENNEVEDNPSAVDDVTNEPTDETAVEYTPDDNADVHRTDDAAASHTSLTESIPSAGEVNNNAPGLSTEIARVGVICPPGMESFVKPVVEFLSESFPVKTCYTTNSAELTAVINWADIVWIEWANELAVEFTRVMPPNSGKRVICRLHSYEAFTPFPQQIDWSKVDDLIFVAHHIKDHVLQTVPGLAETVRRIHVIPSGVDLEKFPFTARQCGTSLAYVGYINYKKGPMLLVHAIERLVRLNPEYKLHIAGKIQDDRYTLYWQQMVTEMGLQNNLQFDGWIEDLPSWLADKQYIISSSVLESQGMGIMEAMACGLKPVVHNFVGARGIYDSKYLWNTINDFVEQVASPEYDSAEYRGFIEQNYSLGRQREAIIGVVSHLAAQRPHVAGQTAAAPGQTTGNQPESFCGAGSYLANTREMRTFLEEVLKNYDIKSMIDVGCGDWNWMKLVDLDGIEYTGYDLDEEFIRQNREKYPDHNFEVADALNTSWPAVDLILCRDVFIHLKNDDIQKLLDSFKRSGARYLVATSYDFLKMNADFTDQQKQYRYTRISRPSRLVNLAIEPYGLGDPDVYIRENNSEACQNRIIGIWKLK